MSQNLKIIYLYIFHRWTGSREKHNFISQEHSRHYRDKNMIHIMDMYEGLLYSLTLLLYNFRFYLIPLLLFSNFFY